MIGSACKTLIGHATLGQIRQFCGQKGQFFGQFDGRGANFLADLGDGGLNRHAAFDADQQQVQTVGKGLDNGRPALASHIADIEVGRVIPGPSRQNDEGDLVDLRHGRAAHNEDVNGCRHSEGKGQDKPEKVECGHRPGPPEAGLGQLVDDLWVFQKAVEVQAVDDLFVEALVGVPQTSGAAIGQGFPGLPSQLIPAG